MGISAHFCLSMTCFFRCREPNVWNCCYVHSTLLHTKVSTTARSHWATTQARGVTLFGTASHKPLGSAPVLTAAKLSSTQNLKFSTQKTVLSSEPPICPLMIYRTIRLRVPSQGIPARSDQLTHRSETGLARPIGAQSLYGLLHMSEVKSGGALYLSHHRLDGHAIAHAHTPW
jgi:hypothetical protein